MARNKRAADDVRDGFSAEERAAMRERAQELKAAARRSGRAKQEEDANAVLAKIAELPEPDRTMATRLHTIITTNAPALAPRLWYGMPAYAKDGKVICFVQSAQKFNTRYTTLGFSDAAMLDDGVMWPTAFALTELTPAAEAQIAALVRRAVDGVAE
ncbi:DUF1801 domain-containing protein [Chloroflexus sp.]|uniref:iron chaperone n=1 Tax=Chloroflexus sp. TaxID=1904827 RepID=UPI002ACE8A04|nr:DUF1801 domain-containing protein [Chloroflexus sp.]